ncbi:MAG: gliding motility-associated C-terminal domain-containing protein [Flavobacteriales bacterium]|nr:gliding motility-associated C-terminal domain-containing protein [Flavobacteriales bacterium]MCB9449464.1 gliding motility-associated C-terminal domain-containing protein [Flavobacteriales bacterium]
MRRNVWLKCVLLFLGLGLGFRASATHIVGGELNYDCLGNDQYKISLTVYRDCYNGVPDFDNPAAVGIFNANNNLVQTLWIPFVSKTLLTPEAPDPCVVVPGNVCYERTTYTATVTLPPIPGGYQLSYQRCCRNQTIVNLVNPSNVGATYTANIPDISKGVCNANPIINEWPPVFICRGFDLVYDHSATDPDGDSLVYELCNPFTSGSNPAEPQPPNNPPYTSVPWKAPYGLSNLMGGTPVTIDPVTGLLTGTPNTVGQFVVGVCVKEYRNGVYLGETKRDFQFNVLQCERDVVAGAVGSTVNCLTTTVDFTNLSSGACDYHWDFGDPTATNDTSNVSNPSYTYPYHGTFTVTLIAKSCNNPNCNDTVVDLVVSPDTCLPCDMTLTMAKSDANCGGTLTECGTGSMVTSDGVNKTFLEWVVINGKQAKITCTVPCADCNALTIYDGCANGSSSSGGCGGTSTNGWCDSGCATCVSCTDLRTVCDGDTVLGAKIPANNTMPGTMVCDTAYVGGPGIASVTPNGGQAPYTYLWNTGQTTSTITGLDPGSYTVTVLDNANCIAVSSVTVQGNSPITITLNSTDPSWCNNTDGSVGVTATGGSGSYTYSWSPGGMTTATVTGLTAGTYFVLVDDGGGCPEAGEVTLVEPNPLVLTTTPDAVVCSDDCDGNISVSIAGGTGPYTYTWYPTNGSTSNSMSGLCKGSYAVTVSDNSGCDLVEVVTVSGPTPLTLTVLGTDISCTGSTDGTTTVSASGGTPGYTYSWSSGSSNATATGLTAGTYTVTVTDNNGCTETASVTINTPNPLTVELDDLSSTACDGTFTGTIEAKVSGGTIDTTGPPTVYYTEDFSGYTNGTKTGSGTPAKWTVGGSSSIDWWEVRNGHFEGRDMNGEVTWTSKCIDISSCVNVTMSIDVAGTSDLDVDDYFHVYYTVDGGAEQPLFLLNDDTAQTVYPTFQTFSSNLPDGGCVRIIVRAIANGNLEQYFFDNVTVSCEPIVEPFSYLWCDGQTTAIATGLSPGTCGVTVTDNNGCSDTDALTISSNDAFTVTLSSTDACGGVANGTATVTPSGGVPIYTYLWCGGQTTQAINNLGGGNCSVTVTDGNGCTEVLTASINASPPINVSTAIDCRFANIDVTATGGTPPFTYVWNDGATTEDRTNLTDGIYTVYVWDQNNCYEVITDTVTVCVCDISLTGTPTDVSCNGGSNGSLNVTTTGGTSPYTYIWSNGKTTEDITGLTAGSYTLTVTDVNLCDETITLTVGEPTDISLTATGTAALCYGGATGSIDLTPSGGTPGYTYVWSNGRTTQDITGLTAGTYTVTVTDNNGCTDVISRTIGQATDISLSLTPTNTSCFSGTNGSLTLTRSGGTPGYTYVWSNGRTTQNLTGVAAGTYTVTVTDSHGCSKSINGTINQPTDFTTSTTAVNNVCSGDAAGSIDLTVSGATPSYTYVWSNGRTTQDISGLTAGTYTVTITDNNSCTEIVTETITEPTVLSLTATPYNVLCFGGSTGSVNLTVSGGTPGYTYTWSNGRTTEDISGLPIGTYTVTVTDNNGCSDVTSAYVSQPTALTASGTPTSSSCGNNDGSIDLTVNGGTSPYTYLWNNGQTTQDLGSVGSGTYQVTVTDNNGCKRTASVNVDDVGGPAPLIYTVTDVTCNGLSDGTIDLSVLGGTPPYTYLWNDGVTTEDRSGLSIGTYGVTVHDDLGCQAVTTIDINQPDPLTESNVGTNLMCFGDNSGKVDLTVGGGTPNYTYLWSNGATIEDATGLAAGTYTVTVTDANGCQITSTGTLGEPTQLSDVISSTTVTCAGPDGTASVSVSGGTPNYTYAWSGGETTASISGLPIGSVSVTITDAHGCTLADTVAVVNGCMPTVSMNNDTICIGSCTTIEAYPDFGIPPYSFAWDNGITSTTSGPISVCPTTTTTYSVTLTDNDGNQTTASGTVLVNPLPVLTIGGTQATCNMCNGTATVSASGTSPFDYLWSNGGTTPTITGLCDGPYSVTVTDANGCLDTASVAIQQSGSPSSVLFTTPLTCAGDNTGLIDQTVTGGTPGYTFIWSNGETTEDLTGVTAGTYVVTVTDQLGCSDTAQITLTEPTQLIASVINDTVACYGDSSGILTILASGGTPSYTYEWSTGATGIQITGLTAGGFGVTVTDANGCVVSTSAQVVQPGLLTLGVTETPVSCNSGSDGAIDLTVLGGNAPFMYDWSDGSHAEDPTSLTAGSYTVTVTDSKGCSDSISATITEPAALSLTIRSIPATCHGGANGSAVVTASGGTPAYQYLWNSIPAQTNLAATGLTAGTYMVTVTDANGCSDSISVGVSEPDSIVISVIREPETCERTNGSFTAFVSGGSPDYRYLWSNGQTDSLITGLGAGVYELTVTDANGCTGVYADSLIDIPGPTVDFTANNACEGDSSYFLYTGTGSITDCLWDFGDGTNARICGDVVHLYTDTGTFTILLTVTDQYGCTATATRTLEVFPVPDVIATADTTQGCVPVTVSFNQQSTNDSTYYWDFGDGTTSDLPNPIHTYYSSGTYTVNLWVMSPMGCSSDTSMSSTLTVNVWDRPTAYFTVDPPEQSILNPVFNFTDKSIDPNAWYWFFGDGDESHIQNPLHTYDDTGWYDVTLILTNMYGCTDTLVKPVHIRGEYTFYNPNAFSPNKDGKNELFFPKMIGVCECEMYIFDRWGNEIYITNDCTDNSNGWPGTANGGTEIVQEDVYVWMVITRDCFGKPHSYIGHVTVVK